LRAYNAAKCNCGRAPAWNPLKELTALPDLLAGFKGGKVREAEGRGGRLTLMRSFNRASDWLRPALSVSCEMKLAVFSL